MLSKKAAATPEAAPPQTKVRAGDRGTRLLRYFVPLVLLAILVLVGLAVLGGRTIQVAKQEQAERGARQAAEVLARELGETVAGARRLLRYMAAEPRVAAVLEDSPSQREQLAERLSAAAPLLLQVRLLPRGWDAPDPTGAAPFGYAGVDLVRRVQREGRAPAEAHQLKSPHPYVAVAEAVGGQEVRGVLFGALPLAQLERPLLDLPATAGRFWLTQDVGGDLVTVGGDAGAEAPEGRVAIADTTLEVAYRTAASGALDTASLTLLGAAALAIALVVGVAVLQARRLGTDLRADMGAVVTLGEAILKRESGAPPDVRVRASADALLLLAEYAKQARVAESNGPGGQAKAPVQSAPGPAAAAFGQKDDAMVVEEVEEPPASGKEAATDADAEGAENRGMPRRVFRAYDIRGRADSDFDEHGVKLLGRALGTLVKEQGGNQVAVARDVRISSRELAAALVDGLVTAGCDVIDLGQVPTPVLYFARYSLEVDAGVMVTGSHNPPEYNGFKIMLGDEVLAGKALRGLYERLSSGSMAGGAGTVREQDLGTAYLEYILGDVALSREFKLVLDAGNGVAGDLAVRLFEGLGCEVVALHCQPDGRFPNHHPDPGRPENLQDLIEEVRANRADLGIAFDGDGDRLGVVDADGNPVVPDRVLMLLAADVLVRHPGADILYDVKSSRHLAGFILANGGRPIMWRSGHARMKAKLRQTGGLLAGEFAGHYFIKERWFGFDDALYAAARLLEVLSADPREPAEIFAELPASPGTPELLLRLAEGHSLVLMHKLAEQAAFTEAKLIDLDGLRVEFADGWGLVRPSNTEPALTFRFEGDNPEAITRIQGAFRDWLHGVDSSLELPF
ncbi:MAG: phosphomannomutase/phosphoglucomutase [Gammaproteobacteria bacterium]